MTIDLPNDYYTVKEAAWDLTLSESTVKRLIAANKIFALIIGNGRCIRVLKSSVEEYKLLRNADRELF